MAGRGKMDKSQRRNNYPPAKPGDLDQFGQAIDEHLSPGTEGTNGCLAADDTDK
ncbi:MAG: hypothetical protein H0Z34_09020 [Brevibacillus sp.]|nr:hypothetical protein [Brevibacillus sp.]